MNTVFTETIDGVNASINQLEVTCITSKQNKFHLDSEGNLSVNSITTVVDNSNTSQTVDFNSIYPIGVIYMSLVNTNPETLFGGTWERVEGCFLLGANSTYKAGTTGGEESHTLSIDEMPKHTHQIYQGVDGKRTDVSLYGYYAPTDVTGYQNFKAKEVTFCRTNSIYEVKNDNTGGSQPHNNMPPYLAVYMWKRVA